MHLSNYKYIIIGSGFFGSVVAERIASQKHEKVLIIEKRNHIGGNSYSEIDKDTGIEVHKYGSHIFHTKSQKVWDYISNFMKLNNYRHKVLTVYKNKIYQMPINLSTINNFYNINLGSYEVSDFIKNEIDKENIKKPGNLEEKAISLIGRPLYEAFIKGYTKKQWETDPKKLPSDTITRLPFRSDYNSDYFDDFIQGIPIEGYTDIFKKILNHKNIELLLNTDYFIVREKIPKNSIVIYTGPIDRFFNYKYGELGWRTLDFESEIIDVDDYQGTAVMNYAEQDMKYT
ncbi:MAG: NAD(P)-binding protein, partial [Spirochaetes bacterium]|nr:NAD(P)-binding protein [Spirochaetota bacterium]